MKLLILGSYLLAIYKRVRNAEEIANSLVLRLTFSCPASTSLFSLSKGSEVLRHRWYAHLLLDKKHSENIKEGQREIIQCNTDISLPSNLYPLSTQMEMN